MKRKTNITIGSILLLVGFLVGFFTHNLIIPTQEKTFPNPYTALPSNQQKPPEDTSKDEVLKLVANLQEVKEFKKRIEAIGKTKAIVAIDSYPNSEKPYYLVHVFEKVPNGADLFHSATFNWYRVDPKTWIVERMDLSVEKEKWDIVSY